MQLPSSRQLDALREVTNVGGGHAANAFSRLVGGQVVQTEVPVVNFEVTSLAELLDADTRLVGISFLILGELSGRMMLVLAEPDARALGALLLHAPEAKALTAAERSALCEAGNIVGSACLAAIGTLTGLKILLSEPSLRAGTAVEVAQSADPDLDATSMVVMQIHFFTAGSPHVRGQLIMMPERQGLATLLSKLGL